MLDNVTYDSVTNKFNITFKIFAISLFHWQRCQEDSFMAVKHCIISAI